MSTSGGTETRDEQSLGVSIVVGLAFAICLALSLTVIHWHGHTVAAIGFCVMVPGLLGAGLNAATGRA